MTDQKELKLKLKDFKIKIKNANESFYELECRFANERKLISDLKNSFVAVIKLIDHELIESCGDMQDLFNLVQTIKE
jgi:hypothetical protein